jgi:SPP1 family predicted phage head-tail adaptor
MRAGQLRHKIEFLTISDGQDEAGGISEVETHLCYAMAEIKPVSGNEKFVANQVFPEATSQIKCRYVAGITTKHKIKFGERQFDILNAQNKDERGIELYIVVKELF